MAANNLYDYYTGQGKALPSLTERAQLYQTQGLGNATDYRGTAEQNTSLLGKLQTPVTTPTIPAPVVPAAITSNSLSTPPPVNYSTPTYTPTNIAGIDTTYKPQEQTSQEKTSSALIARLMKLNDESAGKNAYQTEQNTAAGVDTVQQSIADLNVSIKQLQNDAAGASLKAEDRLIPTFAITGEQQKIERARAVKALTFSSLSDALQNNLVSAQHKADQAVAAKYGPIEDEIAAKTKNLTLILNDPLTSLQDKNRAGALLAQQEQQKAQIEEAKTLQKDISKISIDAASQSKEFTPTAQYPTVSTALTAIAAAKTVEEATSIAATTGLIAGGKYDTFTQDGNLYQVKKDAQGKVIGTPQLIKGGGGGAASVVKSGALNYTKTDYAEDSKILEDSRGSDGHVDSALYLQLFNAWKAAGGEPKDFISQFPPDLYTNPQDTSIPEYLRPKSKGGLDFSNL